MHARMHACTMRINAQLPGKPIQFSVNGKDSFKPFVTKNNKMTTKLNTKKQHLEVQRN